MKIKGRDASLVEKRKPDWKEIKCGVCDLLSEFQALVFTKAVIAHASLKRLFHRTAEAVLMHAASFASILIPNSL